MRSIKRRLLMTGMIACGPLVATGSFSGSAAPVGAVRSTPEAAIERAIRGIYSDLKNLKLDFFQLRDIEKAAVSSNSLTYQIGLLHLASRLAPESFSEYGCYIEVAIQYPATPEEIAMRQRTERVHPETQPQGHNEPVFVFLKNETSYGLWKRIGAEPTRQGRAFAEKVHQIVTARLNAMNEELERQ